jgi:hypothetical protein
MTRAKLSLNNILKFIVRTSIRLAATVLYFKFGLRALANVALACR